MPGIVRALLDPPLHEFLPHSSVDIQDFADETGLEFDYIRNRVQDLHEFNPMLGHRGCRLGVTFPEIYEMQARAIFEAAIETLHRGTKAYPEIMIPLAGTEQELKILKDRVLAIAESVFKEKKQSVPYSIGTMIELPRAALCADKLAEEVEFFSFGTNDLTQTALGLSRDDSSHFMSDYLEQGIFERDPFATLDVEGVGQLIDIAIEKGNKTKPDLKLGVCGEHGGDPSSIAFFEQAGLDYVSCSPYRVPIARLAAAQASIKNKTGRGGEVKVLKRKVA